MEKSKIDFYSGELYHLKAFLDIETQIKLLQEASVFFLITFFCYFVQFIFRLIYVLLLYQTL